MTAVSELPPNRRFAILPLRTMELALFIGIQATGKSSFYKERFYRTHVRVNYDMVKTRDREAILGPSSRLEPPSRGE